MIKSVRTTILFFVSLCLSLTANEKSDHLVTIMECKPDIVEMIKVKFSKGLSSWKLIESDDYTVFLINEAKIIKSKEISPVYNVDLGESGIVILIRWMPLLELWSLDHDFPNHGPSSVLANIENRQYWLVEPLKLRTEDRGGIMSVGIISKQAIKTRETETAVEILCRIREQYKKDK